MDLTGQVYFPISEELKEESFATIEAYVHGDRLLTLVGRLPDEQMIANIFIMERDSFGLRVFYEDYEMVIPLADSLQADETGDCPEQIADITFGEGRGKEIRVKEEKIKTIPEARACMSRVLAETGVRLEPEVRIIH